jgi:hypothetical protein
VCFQAQFPLVSARWAALASLPVGVQIKPNGNIQKQNFKENTMGVVIGPVGNTLKGHLGSTAVKYSLYIYTALKMVAVREVR